MNSSFLAGTSTESVILRSNSVVSRLDESNKGYKLLKNLGWKEGSGLGKDNSGIQQPVTTFTLIVHDFLRYLVFFFEFLFDLFLF